VLRYNFVTSKIPPTQHLVNKIKYVFLKHNRESMGRPKVNDKLVQVPVPVKHSLLERIGRKELIEKIKSLIQTLN
jgi:phage pi2 protein 07